MTARAASRGAASGSRTSRPSHSPASSQRSNVHGRAARAQASGSLQRPCGWNAGPRGESISPGIQDGAGAAPAAGPVRPVAERLDGRRRRLAAPVGLVVGVRPHPIADAGPEVGGVGAVGEIDHGPAARGSRPPTMDSARRRSAARRRPRPARRPRRGAPAPSPSRPRGGRCARSRDPGRWRRSAATTGPSRRPAARTLQERPRTFPARPRSRAGRSRASRARPPVRATAAMSPSGEHVSCYATVGAPPLAARSLCYPARSRLSPRGLGVRSSLRPGDW